MVRKIIQPWWIRKQIALTVARLPSWGLRCCRPKEPLSEPRRGEFRRRAANRRANRTGNAACQEIVFESSWRYILHISFLNAHLLALRTRSIPRSKELGQFYTSEVFNVSAPLRSVQNGHPPDVLHPIYGMVHCNAISDFHSSVESDTFTSSEVWFLNEIRYSSAL